jgi:hypothetical protein
MKIRATLILLALVFALTACKPPAVATPELVIAPTPTSAAVVPLPTATATAPAPAQPTLTLPLSPVATPATVAKHEGSPVASLTLVKLQPGHKYRLVVSSPSSKAAFSGTWTQSATGTDGLPGVKAGLLDGTTPATFDIVPPVASVAKDWVYTASVSNKSVGSIAIAIVDVTP